MSTQIAENLNIPNDQWITASVWGTGNITGDRSQTLIANSAWSQVNGGVPFGTSFGSMVAVRNYRGGTSEIWNGYGGFASTYCGTESQSWNDASIASYDARNLNGTRFTPHSPPGVPAPYPFSTTSKTFVMPPSLVEDAEAAASQNSEGITIGSVVWSLLPGSSLVDAYRDYKKGSLVSAGFNGAMGLFDLASMGALSKGRALIKSGGKAIWSLAKTTAKGSKSLVDDAVRLVRDNSDNVGRSLIDDAAGGAKVCQYDVANKTWTGCFAKGTPILTPYGSKPIEELHPGDWVLAQDESGLEADPKPRMIEEVFHNISQMMTLRVGGHDIETTQEHPFWVRDRGWTPAEEINPGDELRSHDGQWIPLVDKVFSEGLIPVFNMRVAEDHTYFVGSPLWGFSVWAHNSYQDRKLLTASQGGPPEWMENPHAHHILFQKGVGKEQQDMVDAGHKILRHYVIDPVNGIENLVWAPNIKGQHTKEALKLVVKKLIQLKNNGASRAQVINALQELGRIAVNRTIS